MANMNLTPLNVIVDEVWGKKGTPERDTMEIKLKEELHAYQIGEAIKAERLKQNLTQKELGEKIGVQRTQISRMERGCSISLSIMGRAFKALGISTGTLDLGVRGRIALW